MTYILSSFDMWLLRRIFKRAVIQSPEHANNITKIYATLREAAHNEFTEDNTPTLDDFMRERFEISQKMTPDFKLKK